MLTFESHVPDALRPSRAVVVLLHGRGSDEHDLMQLAPHLPSGVRVVAPRAPFPGAPWGYGPGWAWYRFLGEDRPEPDTFRESQAALRHFLSALPGALGHPGEPIGPVFVGGFSQGGTMSLASGLGGAAGPVFNLSGFLPNHPDVSVDPETAGSLRVFWGHGTRDPAIPFALAVTGRERLARAGATLTTGDYPTGHGITADEVRDLSAWIEANE